MNTQCDSKLVKTILGLLVAICGVGGAIALRFQVESNDEKLMPGQVLEIYIQDVLGSPSDAPPMGGWDPDADLYTSLGFPIPIRNDGTVSLPSVGSIFVQGKSAREVRYLVTATYQEILDRENLSVRVGIYPDRTSLTQEDKDRIRFCNFWREKGRRMLGL